MKSLSVAILRLGEVLLSIRLDLQILPVWG